MAHLVTRTGPGMSFLGSVRSYAVSGRLEAMVSRPKAGVRSEKRVSGVKNRVGRWVTTLTCF
jgi:hypothetical protein